MCRTENILQPWLQWEDASLIKPDRTKEVLIDTGIVLHLGYYNSFDDEYLESNDFSVIKAKYWAYIPISPRKE